MLEFYYNVCILKRPWGTSLSLLLEYRFLLLKVKTENLSDDLENSKYISSWMDYTHWDELIYTELVKRQVPKSCYF